MRSTISATCVPSSTQRIQLTERRERIPDRVRVQAERGRYRSNNEQEGNATVTDTEFP